MNEKTAIELGSVQKTLLLPLWGRAVETQKAHPLLVDRTALAIMQRMEYDFATIARNMNELTQSAWILRSVCVDDVVGAFLAIHPRGTVINLGCGLDTTFDRVDNGTMLWYDVDLPDVIALRRRFIRETPRRVFIAASMLDRDWLTAVEIREQVLFVAAGVMYYYDGHQVRDVLKRQADMFHGSQIVMDVSSPYGVRVANKVVIRKSGLDERSYLRWGCKDPASIVAWDPRFRLLHTYFYFGKRARSLPRKLRILGRLSDALRVQYMVHLEMAS